MSSTRIKFCGITRLEDAVSAVDAGAWAIGFILWPGSARFIAPEEAQLIARQVRRKVRVAGVFVDQGLDEVVRTAEQIGLDLIQLHGNEGPAFASEIHRRTGAQVIKAARVQNLGDVSALQAYRVDVDFHLLDAFVEGEPGGTGTTFDHTLAREHRRRTALILSGGLNAGNVAHAIEQVAPFAVDVSSGVEVSPGIKDPELIKGFAAAVVAATPEPDHPEEVDETGHESGRREAPTERGDWPAGSAEEATQDRGDEKPDTGEEVAQMRDETYEPQSGEDPEMTPQDGAQEEVLSETDPDAGASANDLAIDEIVAQAEGTELVVDEEAEALLDDLDPLEESESSEARAFGGEGDLVIGDADDDGDGWTEVTSSDATP
ncbi:MAG: phosphoribosylanthranilate isomerase, partial [Solirubrobacteraceae bacterium]|nr:phosphoribosylanthranilate isomerase [Solirubrobacteraceae bacterium]